MSRDQRGVATVLALALSALLIVVAAVALGIGSLIAAHRRVAAAADLAALGAAAAREHGEDPCASAAGIARANGAELVDCRTDGDAVVVTTRAHPRGLPAGVDVRARARAGPG